jgi:hypothetical protein
MIKWTSIGGFHNVNKLLEVYPNLNNGEVTYRAKIKLHGTNGGVVIDPNGKVTAQSREAVLTPKNDNKNFCKECVLANEEYWSGLARSETITVFGEWCGPGIMKGTAINKIPEKMFAVFAIQLEDDIVDEFGYPHAKTIIDPDIITKRLSNSTGELPDNVCVIPWLGDEITVEYADKASKEAAIDTMNAVVADVELVDPWVKDKFKVVGIGEGVVYYPTNLVHDYWLDKHDMSVYSFKAKGEKHKVTKTKKSVQIDPEVTASIDEFVTMVVTPARLEQGAISVGGEQHFEQRYIGAFIKWMCEDVLKETADELEASGLTWKQVSNPVSAAARNWYLDKFREL